MPRKDTKIARIAIMLRDIPPQCRQLATEIDGNASTHGQRETVTG